MSRKEEEKQTPMVPDLLISQSRQTIKLADIGRHIHIKRKQDDLTLEEASLQCGVSTATLWRLERNATRGAEKKTYAEPDMRTLSKLAKWLDVYVERVIDAEPTALTDGVSHSASATTPDAVAAHLRADRNLNPETAEALARMFRVAYEQFSTLRGPASDDEN